MGNYRTTLFRRDFNRLQAQRNQGLPKELVSVKLGSNQLEKGTASDPLDALELESRQSVSSGGADSLERGPAVTDGLLNVNLEQASAVSDDGRLVEKYFSTLKEKFRISKRSCNVLFIT